MKDGNQAPKITLRRIRGWAVLAAAAVVVAVLVLLMRPEPESPPAGPGGWLTGTDSEKIDRLAAQHGGFGVAMWEIGHRYRELAWAGEVGDWDYARYQLEYIEQALWRGVDRRPAYEAPATDFVQTAIAPLRDTLASNPEAGFADRFSQFTNGCIRCHQREESPVMDLERWISAGPTKRPRE